MDLRYPPLHINGEGFTLKGFTLKGTKGGDVSKINWSYLRE
jgi:hypothetical protein